MTRNRSIGPISLLLFTVLAIAVNWPVLQGKVPLPSGIVTFFPPWEHLHQGAPAWPHVSELGDLVTAFYPWRAFTAEGFKGGELPLWNPRVLAGTPFLGATQSALFSPLTLLYAVFNMHVAWTLNILLRIVLAGFFTSLFAARLGITRTGALAAGVIYVLSGSFVVWQGQALGDAWVWLPAVLYGIERLYIQPSALGIAFLGAVFAMPILVGHPETAFHIVAFGVIFATFRLISLDRQRRLRYTLTFAAAAILACALAAVQILPTLEWLTQIDAELGGLYPGSPTLELLALLCRDIRSNPNSAGIHIPEGAAYAGMMALLLSGFAFVGTNRRSAVFWALAVAAGLQIAYGFGPVDGLIDQVPIVRALKNNRVVVIVNFGIAILAAMGISFLQNETDRGSRTRNWAILGGSSALVTAGILVLRSHTVFHVPDWDQTPRVAFLFLTLGAVTISLRLVGSLTGKTFSGIALGVLILDMATFSFAAVPFAKPAEIFPRAPVFDYLSQEKPTFRIAAVDSAYVPNFDMMYGVSTISGYEVWIKRTAKLMDSLRTPGVVGMAVSAKGIVEANNRVLDLLNVRYLVTTTSSSAPELLSARSDRFTPVFSQGSIRVFENRSVLPRAFAVASGCVEVAPSDERQLERVTDPGFDPLASVILDAATDSGARCESEAANEVEFLAVESPNRSEINVELERESIVVWSEMHYPGWRVFVDDREQELLRADYNLMAVVAPAGRHRIRFVFDPPSFRIGRGISLSALAVLLGLVLASKRRTRESG